MTNPLAIPVVQVYGEADGSATADYLHCESLITRSREHQFRIRPHRHPGLSQLFYLREGSGEATIDGRQLAVCAPTLILISDMSVHDFLWSDDVEGSVLSIASPRLEQTRRALDRETLRLGQTALLTLPAEHDGLQRILNLLMEEYQRAADDRRDLALQSLVNLLAIEIERLQPQGMAGSPEGATQHRGSELFRQYVQQVNSDYAQHRTLASYAEQLGITAPYLNQLCKQLTGRSAQQILHERLLLEAKRNLLYTALRVNEIAYQLGFSDPAYFTRFFRRLAGQSPLGFRRAHTPAEM